MFENGSTDDVFDKLVALIRRDPRCKVVHFARNFRADGGVAADVSHAEGAAAVIMCADLRDT